jgi:hypothetical protein
VLRTAVGFRNGKSQAPSTQLQTPSTKHQIPNKRQIQNSKKRRQKGFAICLLFGIWNL